MLIIECGGEEYFDEASSSFLTRGSITLRFEHSLKSISKWEEHFLQPFPLFSSSEFSQEELMYYISCMALDDIFSFEYINESNAIEIVDYIKRRKTATTFTESHTSKSSNSKSITLTSEVIYAYMANAGIPYECDTWNIDKLLTVLRVIGELNSPSEKMNDKDVMQQNSDLNKMRRAKYNSKG